MQKYENKYAPANIFVSKVYYTFVWKMTRDTLILANCVQVSNKSQCERETSLQVLQDITGDLNKAKPITLWATWIQESETKLYLASCKNLTNETEMIMETFSKRLLWEWAEIKQHFLRW